MNILINNLHDEASGGGGYYCSQIIKACASFANVFLMKQPLKERFENNPELRCEISVYSGEDVDVFLDVNHFGSVIKESAKKNIKICYFPDQEHDGSPYDEIVTLSEYSHKWVKNYWNRDAKICKPYSKPLVAGEKHKNTIVTTGNIFYEGDGHCKNQHILIDAFKLLEGDWTFRIIGNVLHQDYFESLKDRAKGYNIEFYPSLDDETKEQYLRNSEFYWHGNGYKRTKPTQSEHFGIGAEEGIKSGCLTYVSPNGGVQDFCTTWDTPEQLAEMTQNRTPNKCIPDYQTPEKMAEFFKQLLSED